MRQLTSGLAVAAIGIVVAACGGNDESSPASSSTTTTTSSRPPVAQAALANLLLTTAEIDSTLGVTGTTSKEKADKLTDDSNKPWPQGWKFPSECLFAYGPGESTVYAGSGYTAVTGDDDVASLPPGSNDPDPEVTQLVVLFPSAKAANDFFTTSSQRWPACADRQFTTPGDAETPEAVWKLGPLSTANATLSITISMTMSRGATTITAACQRALTVRNNVAIDVSGCRTAPGDTGVKVAGQIATKVDNQ